MSTKVRRLTGWAGVAACVGAFIFIAAGVHLWAIQAGHRRLSTLQFDDYYVTGPVTVEILLVVGVALAGGVGALMVRFVRLAVGMGAASRGQSAEDLADQSIR